MATLQSDISTAFHEAGHAVLARYFGKTIVEIAIFPYYGNKQSDGQTQVSPQNQIAPLDEAVVCLAGFAADDHRAPSTRNWEDDANYAGDRKALLDALMPCLPDNISEDDVDHYDPLIQIAMMKAKELVAVPAHQRAITKIANVLFDSKRIRGTEAMMIIDQELRS